jgi:hypothetical protein
MMQGNLGGLFQGEKKKNASYVGGNTVIHKVHITNPVRLEAFGVPFLLEPSVCIGNIFNCYSVCLQGSWALRWGI